MPKTELEGDALLKQLFPAGFPFLTESLKDKKLEIKYKAPAKFEMLGECGEVQYVVLPDFLMGTKLLQQLQAMSIRWVNLGIFFRRHFGRTSVFQRPECDGTTNLHFDGIRIISATGPHFDRGFDCETAICIPIMPVIIFTNRGIL